MPGRSPASCRSVTTEVRVAASGPSSASPHPVICAAASRPWPTTKTLLARSLEHRFDDGTLSGHPIGNLLLVGLAFAAGDLQAAIDEVGRLVGAVGRVFPASEVPVTLIADSDHGTLAGQVTIERATGIGNLRFDPTNASTPRGAIEEVVERRSDHHRTGLALHLGAGLRPHARHSGGPAGNRRPADLRGQCGPTRRGMREGFGLREHVEALIDHGLAVDVVLAAGPTGHCAGFSGPTAGGDGRCCRPRRVEPRPRQTW